MGLSPQHTTTSPLVLRPSTRYITSQWNVVFDDWFATVSSANGTLPDFDSNKQTKIFGDSEFQYPESNETNPTNDDEPAPEQPLAGPPVTGGDDPAPRSLNAAHHPSPAPHVPHSMAPTPSTTAGPIRQSSPPDLSAGPQTSQGLPPVPPLPRGRPR